MRVALSVLCSGLSGASADVVAATWKGVQYVRRRVTPKYTNTADQIIRRRDFSRMPLWWRSFPANLVVLLKAAAVGLKMSAFNVVSKVNLTAFFEEVVPQLYAGLGSISNVSNFACVAGPTKGISMSWDAGAAPATDYVLPFSIPVDPTTAPTAEADQVTFYSPVLVSAKSGGIVVLGTGGDYFVGGIVIRGATIAAATKVSDPVVVQATSGV